MENKTYYNVERIIKFIQLAATFIAGIATVAMGFLISCKDSNLIG